MKKNSEDLSKNPTDADLPREDANCNVENDPALAVLAAHLEAMAPELAFQESLKFKILENFTEQFSARASEK